MASLNLPSIAFPEQIGCGLAGGDWGAYERMLEEFADANPDVRVYICRRPGDGGGSGSGWPRR